MPTLLLMPLSNPLKNNSEEQTRPPARTRRTLFPSG